jgi:hypothetical protein
MYCDSLPHSTPALHFRTPSQHSCTALPALPHRTPALHFRTALPHCTPPLHSPTARPHPALLHCTPALQKSWKQGFFKSLCHSQIASRQRKYHYQLIISVTSQEYFRRDLISGRTRWLTFNPSKISSPTTVLMQITLSLTDRVTPAQISVPETDVNNESRICLKRSHFWQDAMVDFQPVKHLEANKACDACTHRFNKMMCFR